MCFIVVNLLLGVLVNNFQIANDEEEVRLEHEELARLDSMDALFYMDGDSDDEVTDEIVHRILQQEEHDCLQSETKADDHEFNEFFHHLPQEDFQLREWYYRLLPACERQIFMFDDQFHAFQSMLDEAME